MYFKKIPQSQYHSWYIETPRQKKIRLLLVAVIFSSVLYGFWWNYQTRLDEMSYSGGKNSDATQTLSKEEVGILKAYAAKFYQHYGVKLDVRVQSELWPPVLPKGVNSTDTIFIGLCPDKGQLMLSFPPLVNKLLPKNFIDSAQHTYFTKGFADGTWPSGLAEFLNSIMKEFDKALGDAVDDGAS